MRGGWEDVDIVRFVVWVKPKSCLTSRSRVAAVTVAGPPPGRHIGFEVNISVLTVVSVDLVCVTVFADAARLDMFIAASGKAFASWLLRCDDPSGPRGKPGDLM